MPLHCLQGPILWYQQRTRRSVNRLTPLGLTWISVLNDAYLYTV